MVGLGDQTMGRDREMKENKEEVEDCYSMGLKGYGYYVQGGEGESATAVRETNLNKREPGEK